MTVDLDEPADRFSLQAVLQNCSLWDHDHEWLELGDGRHYRIVGWDADIWSFILKEIP